jgi:hypothetical protein
VELGPTYLPGRELPDRPGPWVSGVAWLDDGTVAVADWRGRCVTTVGDTGEIVGTVRDLSAPRGVHALGGERYVVCEPGLWRLSVCTADRVLARVDTHPVQPWYAAPFRGGWLVVDSTTDVVHLLDLSGSGVRVVTPGLVPHALRSVVPCDDDTFVVCDQGGHVAVRTTLDGDVLDAVGAYGHPADAPGCFIGPEHAVPLADGRVLVTDTRNNRLVRADWSGSHEVLLGGGGKVGSADGHLWSPIAATVDDRGRVVVADAGNGRALLVEPDGSSRTLWGEPRVLHSQFQYPRSQQATDRGFLVADSYHNRIVEIDHDGAVLHEYAEALGTGFFWPRFATRIGETTFLCDSRNARVLTAVGQREPELFVPVYAGEPVPLRDPHTIRRTPRGLLVTDTKAARVVHATVDGQVVELWESRPAGAPGVGVRIGASLDDVHDADLAHDGSLWLADTGHGRLAHVAADGRLLGTVSRLTDAAGVEVMGLSYPRTVEVLDPGHLLVTDSGNHRVVVVTWDGTLVWAYGSGDRGHAHGCLSDPRHAAWHGERTVLISDYGNNRLLRVRGPALGGTGEEHG